MKYPSLILIVLLVLSTLFIGACGDVTVSKSTENGILTTKQSQTTCGISGCQSESHTCPFWDRNC